MKYILLLLFCGGVERWDVKTLQDKDANLVSFTAHKVTVHYLVNLKTFSPEYSTPRQELEKRTYKVTAILKSYQREEDGDIHAVIQDLSHGETMIVEFPDYNCDRVQKSIKLSKIKQARDSFLSVAKPGNIYSFIGVAFVDLFHNQTGVAKNLIELHPIINFSVVSIKKYMGKGKPTKPSKPKPASPRPSTGVGM